MISAKAEIIMLLAFVRSRAKTESVAVKAETIILSDFSTMISAFAMMS